MSELVYCNLTKGTPHSGKTGGLYAFRAAVAGEVRRIGLRFTEDIAGRTIEADPDILSIQVCVGQIDARPLGGKIAYQFGSGASTADNTTAELPAKHTAAALKAVIPAAVILAYGTPVAEDVPGGVTLTFETNVAITPRLNSLWPLSFLRVNAWEIPEGGWVHDLRMVQAPLVQTTAYVRELPPQPSVATIRDGGTDTSGTYRWSEIQELTVPISFRGTFHLRNPATLARTTVLSSADNARTIGEAIAKIYTDGTIKVTNPDDQVARVEWLGEYVGENLAAMEVFVDDAPPGDPTLTLDFRLASVYAALRGATSFGAFIEARAIIARSGVPEGEPVVLFRVPMAVIRDQNWDGMSTQVTPIWLRPPNPINYKPYSDDQVLVGSFHYTEVIGDGVATVIVIDHGLSSEQLTALCVRENDTPGNVITDYQATITGTDSITLTFPTAPASNSLVVNITAAGTVSAFAAHEHSQEQITDLVPLLEDVFARLTALESLVGRTDVVLVVSGNKPAAFALPTVGEVLPDIVNEDSIATVASQVTVPSSSGAASTIGGTELEEAKAAALADLARLTAELEAVKAAKAEAAKAAAAEAAAAVVVEKTTSTVTRISFPGLSATIWPALRSGTKMPWLLPAIHDTSATDAPTLPALVAGSLYNATASLVLPGGGGRKSQSVVSGDKFASDGRCLYRVVRNGSTDSWHALEMERELLRAVLRAEQFPAGSELALGWSLTASLLVDQLDAAARDIARTVDGAQYLLIAEALPLPDATSPGTPGANLGAEGTAVTLCSSRIILSPATEEHAFSMKLRRDAAGVGTGTITRYGVAAETPALPSGPFVLRMRLSGFDVDDTSADPRGQVSLVMPASQLTISITR